MKTVCVTIFIVLIVVVLLIIFSLMRISGKLSAQERERWGE